jgi:glycerate dehydrogenase
MSFNKAVFIKYSGTELDPSHWERIDKICKERILIPADDPGLESQLKDADCILVKLGATVGKDLIDKTPKLRYIGMFGTGVNKIDKKYAASKGIVVCNVADYATEGVAEFVFGILLEFIREIERAKRQARARAGSFSEDTYFDVTEIKGKQFGVIGLGHIGGRIAEIAQAFGANVKYWSRNRKERYEKMGIAYQELDTLLEKSDVISLNLEKNDNTNNFLNKDRVQKIKEGAIVINPSPMELVDLDAILARVKQKDMVFILDHPDEMSPEQINKMEPFMGKKSNLVVYPPVGYTTKEASALKKEKFVSDLEKFVDGKQPENQVA